MISRITNAPLTQQQKSQQKMGFGAVQFDNASPLLQDLFTMAKSSAGLNKAFKPIEDNLEIIVSGDEKKAIAFIQKQTKGGTYTIPNPPTVKAKNISSLETAQEFVGSIIESGVKLYQDTLKNVLNAGEHLRNK